MINIITIHHSKERTRRLYTLTNNNKGTMSPTYLSFSEKATMRQTKLVDDRYTNNKYLFLAQQLKIINCFTL